MNCLYNVERKDGAFFQETVVDACCPEKPLYCARIARKADPLLIVFLNSFSQEDFLPHRIPRLFLEMLLHFRTNRAVTAICPRGGVNSAFLSQWLASDSWKEGLSEDDKKDTTYLFLLWCVLETLLHPLIALKDHEDIIPAFLAADWQQVCRGQEVTEPLRNYLEQLYPRITELGLFWSFVSHQAEFPKDGAIGFFPEKKVRYFCKRCLSISLNTRFPEQPQKLLQNSNLDCKDLFSSFDEEYCQYAALLECFQARALLDILCLSLLHFAVYHVPVRKCSLCRRFYIPRKNQSTDLNYCHRAYKAGAKQSCSALHSHNQKISFSQRTETPLVQFENQVKSQRSILSQSPVNHLPNGPGWIGFLRDSITALNWQVRKDSAQVEECLTLLECVKDMHMVLKRRRHCPELRTSPFYPRKIEMEALRSKLKEASDRIAAG